MDMKELLTDDETEKILKATYHMARNPVEISEIYGIPIARCYRKIKVLQDAGLLEAVSSIKDAKGRKLTYYKANMENAYVSFNNGKLRIRFETLLGMSSAVRQRILLSGT